MLGNVRPILLMLLSGAGLLLAIACINVMSLLLARSDSRTREIAVRNALGASTARLVLQFATEAVLLAAIGGVVGLMLAATGMPLLASLLSADMIGRMPYLQEIGLNLRLVTFASVVAMIAASVFALTPVVRMSVSETLAGLKEGSRGSAGTNWRRLGAHLVVAELAVAVLLLVSAGLLGKSLYRLLNVDTGFNAQELATVSVTPVSVRRESTSGTAGPNDEQPGALARRVAERVAALPAIQSVGYADVLPLGPGLAPSSTFWVVGRSDEGQFREDWPVRRISADYFTTLQARLQRGRYFTAEEVSSNRPVMIINETAARRYFPGDDPIGRSIALGAAASQAREIVGIVADIKDGPPETPPHPSAYVPFDQAGFALVIRTLPEHTPFPSLVSAIREIQPDALVGGVRTMTERRNSLPSTSLHRSSAWLIGGCAAMALVLSVVGLYGVVAYSVGQRTREIGVRMALGAQRRSVYGLILGEATWLVGIGSALGVMCAVTAAPLMRHFLFGVQSWDPPTLVTAAAVLIVSALVASYIPARRAASVNPIEVLRAE
jgi:predicted permease